MSVARRVSYVRHFWRKLRRIEPARTRGRLDGLRLQPYWAPDVRGPERTADRVHEPTIAAPRLSRAARSNPLFNIPI